MAGTLDSADLSPESFAQIVESRIEGNMGLRDQIRVSVTILSHPPVYVIGDVRAPGQHPFQPGMTVLQAIALAQGIDNPAADLVRGDRSLLNAVGSYRVLEIELSGRLATLARLSAELNDRSIEPPESLTRTSFGQELIEREKQIKSVRDESLQSNLEQLDELEALLEERIERLAQQIDLRERQQEIVDEELANITQLAERGLTTSSRRSDLERQVADQQVRRLELETARLNAEQSLNETQRDRLDLINTRRRNLVESIQSQSEAIKRIRVQMETQAALYSEASDTGSGLLTAIGDAEPLLEITRGAGPDIGVIQVGRTDTIRGGDVLEVTLPTISLEPSTTLLQRSDTSLDSMMNEDGESLSGSQ
ncbi:hypothetical protein [Palleronia sp. THAF1]|uniref:hypothetical protein n=1 Tax=Palleronia sp. THAF1 TaxID=2587842 RepID=UPI000F53AF26|nr:hypothetical protein [Palleronia sp. THAF1]